MIAAFFEGVGAIAQPCTLPVLLSAAVFGLAGGRNLGLAIVAHTIGVALMAWLRFGRTVTVDIADGPAVIAGLIVACAAVVVALAPTGPWRRWAVGTGSLVGGAVAAAVWQPCVGTELAGIVNDAPVDRLGTLVPLSVYVVGTALAALAVAMLPTAVPALQRVMSDRRVMASGAVLGVALGAAMAVGVWGDVINELLERSSA